MNYKEARAYLQDTYKYGSVLGLENMQELMRRLGNPQDELKIIHIGGTNGKGSTLAYISTVLREAGYQVGRYISPTLFCYRERIQINEQYIEKDALARLTTRIREQIDGMVAEGRNHPTAFEIETALSFLYFREQQCDFVVLEVGLGGDMDATNIIQTPILEVLASISMDHMTFLGDTLAEIAGHKAGIIKPHTTVVSMLQQEEAMSVIRETCRERECQLRIADVSQASDIVYADLTDGVLVQKFSYGRYRNLEISLIGSYQIANAVLAVESIEALQSLGYEISEQALRTGLKAAEWRGRFTILHQKPLVIIDGAHNEDGARVLADSLKEYFPNRQIHGIMGVFADKEYEKIIRRIAPLVEDIIAVQTPDHPRALPREELAAVWSQYIGTVSTAENIQDAVREKIESVDPEDVILVFGSLSFLSEVTKVLDNACV